MRSMLPILVEQSRNPTFHLPSPFHNDAPSVWPTTNCVATPQPKYWYFEVVELLKKVLIASVGILFMPETATQVWEALPGVHALRGCGCCSGRGISSSLWCGYWLFRVHSGGVCLPRGHARAAGECALSAHHLPGGRRRSEPCSGAPRFRGNGKACNVYFCTAAEPLARTFLWVCAV
jgi:hypothetical protein